ncbi:MAG TPA: protein kinase [Pirellulales bacterium]|nr:protein kinase [Pirellulales bacterium]
MSISVADFWRLLVESRLLSSEEASQAATAIDRAKPSAGQDLQFVAKSLVQGGKLSRYQARVLASGKPGPFLHGDYVVYDRVESPRLSALYRARHQPTGHPVCLSFLAQAALSNPQALVRLAPQVAVARQASLAQPRLSACYQFVDQGAFKFLVVENLHGDSLDERLKKSDARLSIAAVCRLVRLAALGLSQLHSMGQTHGHVRPANIWLDESGAAKLLQFPLVADPLATRAPPVTVEEQLDYLAPELASAATPPDARSDVYSLGCLLYTLLAGKPPFAGADRASKLDRHAKETPAPINQINPQVPAALAQVLSYLLQKDPAKRYPDAGAVAGALQAYAGSDPQVTPEATLASYQAWLQGSESGQAPAAPTQPAAARPAAPLGPPNGGGFLSDRPSAVAAMPASVGAIPVTAARQAGPVPMATFPASAPRAVTAPAAAVAAPAIVVPTPTMPMVDIGAPAASVAQRRPKQSSQSMLTLGIVGGAVVVLVAVAWLLTSGKEQPPPANDKPPVVATAPPAETETEEPSEDEQSEPQPQFDRHVADKDNGGKEPIQGIGGPIWRSPTAGAPVDLAWLPPGVQVVLALRPADLSRQAEWEKLVDKRTLGTVGQWLTEDLPKVTGKTADGLESVVVGLLDGSPGPPKVALVARSVEEFVADDLSAGWPSAKSEEIEGQVLHVQAGKAFYIPPSGADKLLVIAPVAELREMLKTGGEAPALRRELEILADSSDAERHLTLLAAPNFPLTDGRALFFDEGTKLLEPLRAFLELQDADGRLELSKAVLFSFHLSDNLFLELRVYDNFGRPAQSAARELEQRLTQLPKQVSGYVRDLQLSPYSKPILWDYKSQLDVLHKYARLGIDGKQIVLRAYLPAPAAHNLALGAHLALLEVPGSGAPVAVASAQGPVKAQTVAERLKKKTSLGFPRNTLEQSIKLLGDDLGVEIIILGNDLRDEGITKNQSFGLDEKDQAGDEILRKIMMLADPGGRLVYTIKPKEGGGEDVLYVTTRAAAKKRGDKLPPELETAK